MFLVARVCPWAGCICLPLHVAVAGVAGRGEPGLKLTGLDVTGVSYQVTWASLCRLETVESTVTCT